MWVEEKVPGGKLLCIKVDTQKDSILSVKISGDFFVHPEESITKLESCFTGLKLPLDESALRQKLQNSTSGVLLIGFEIEDLIRLLKKAISL